jgi:hypothetical protein
LFPEKYVFAHLQKVFKEQQASVHAQTQRQNTQIIQAMQQNTPGLLAKARETRAKPELPYERIEQASDSPHLFIGE